MLTFDGELASKILTGLESGAYKQWADTPAEGDADLQEMIDEVGELRDQYGPDMVAALAVFIEKVQSARVTAAELTDHAGEHFWGSGHTVGQVLREFAEEQEAEVSALRRLYDRLEENGATDFFDWTGYADSRQEPLEGLHFVVVPATGVAPTVYLFTGE